MDCICEQSQTDPISGKTNMNYSRVDTADTNGMNDQEKHKRGKVASEY